jgi:hypothetical protein
VVAHTPASRNDVGVSCRLTGIAEPVTVQGLLIPEPVVAICSRNSYIVAPEVSYLLSEGVPGTSMAHAASRQAGTVSSRAPDVANRRTRPRGVDPGRELPLRCSGTHTTTHSVSLWERGGTMPTLLVFHEVDDVDHWLASPKREELFGPLGMTARTFRDPEGSNRVGLLVEVPDISVWQDALQSEAAAEAMKSDGVRPETILGLVEG